VVCFTLADLAFSHASTARFTVTSDGAVKVPKDSAAVVAECHAFASSSEANR
jgi:hypothetical protein